MKDDGKSTEEIMRILNISKGHVEKWYSPKVTHSLIYLLMHVHDVLTETAVYLFIRS